MGGTPPKRRTAQEAAPQPEGEWNDRATPIPDFDPEDFARDSERTALVGEPEPTIDQARRLHFDGQHERALFLLTRILELAPLYPEASELSAVCRVALERECLSAVGTEAAILVAAVSSEELKGFSLDHVSAFLFSVIDGHTNVENVLDISGLPRLLALRHLRNLLHQGITGICVRSDARLRG